MTRRVAPDQPSVSRVPFRVVHVTEATGGGVRMHLRRILPKLVARGVGIDLIASPLRSDPDFERDVADYRELGCRVLFVPMHHSLRPVHDVVAALRIRRQVRAWGSAVLHAHATKAGFLCRLPLPSTMPSVLYSPHAFCFDGMRRGPRRRLRVLFERALVPRTAAFVCVSRAEKSVGVRDLGALDDQVAVAENGIPADLARGLFSREDARGRLGLDPEQVAVGVLGRLAPQKGQDWMLRAVAGMPSPERDFKVVFCGDGPDRRRLEMTARELGLEQCTVWQGYVPGLSRLLRAFDLIVMPSRYEGLSYLLLEALAAGTPVITTDIPANVPREKLRQWVRYVPVEDSRALRGCLRETLSDLQGARSRAQEASAFATAEFTLGKQVETLVDLYRRHAAGSASESD